MVISTKAYIANRRRFAVLCKELAKQLEIPADQAESMARGLIGQITGGESSTKELDARGWAALFKWFNDQGAKLQIKGKKRQKKPRNRDNFPESLPSGRQKALINSLKEAINWQGEKDEDELFRDWMKDSFGFSFYRDRRQAKMVIDGLKSLLVREANVLHKCHLLLENTSIPQRLRSLVYSVRQDIISSRNAGKAAPGGILKVLEIYEERTH